MPPAWDPVVIQADGVCVTFRSFLSDRGRRSRGNAGIVRAQTAPPIPIIGAHNHLFAGGRSRCRS
jgi:hypothetical protein